MTSLVTLVTTTRALLAKACRFSFGRNTKHGQEKNFVLVKVTNSGLEKNIIFYTERQVCKRGIIIQVFLFFYVRIVSRSRLDSACLLLLLAEVPCITNPDNSVTQNWS